MLITKLWWLTSVLIAFVLLETWSDIWRTMPGNHFLKHDHSRGRGFATSELFPAPVFSLTTFQKGSLITGCRGQEDLVKRHSVSRAKDSECITTRPRNAEASAVAPCAVPSVHEMARCQQGKRTKRDEVTAQLTVKHAVLKGTHVKVDCT
jgi:hypothetical protein